MRLWVRALVAVGGLLAGGAVVTYVIAIYGGPIERWIDPWHQRTSMQAAHVLAGAGVTTNRITAMAVFDRWSINAVPPAISEHDIDAVFDPAWIDSYEDPLLQHRKVTRSADGRSLSWVLLPSDTTHHRVVYVFRSGWPMYAMRGVLSGVDTNTFPPVTGAYWERNGIAAGSEEMPEIVMPLGFAVNTVFFAAVMGVLAFGPVWVIRILRRETRRARVQCLECGYKLKSRVALCPECGHKSPRTW